MDYKVMTDATIAKEIGGRIKKLRLRKNLTQEEIASRSLLSVNTIKALESGKGKISTLIAVLRELNSLDHLDAMLPEPSISPLQLAKMKGKQRQRATRKPKQEKRVSKW